MELTAVETKLTCYCCSPSSLWLDLGTQECNGSFLPASAPLSQSLLNFPTSIVAVRYHVFGVYPIAGTLGKTYRYRKVSSIQPATGLRFLFPTTSATRAVRARVTFRFNTSHRCLAMNFKEKRFHFSAL